MNKKIQPTRASRQLNGKCKEISASPGAYVVKDKQPEKLRKRSLTPVCAWCGRVRVANGSWRYVDHSEGKPPARALTHGVCPDCEKKWVKAATPPSVPKIGPDKP